MKTHSGKINKIIIHHSASAQTTTVQNIRDWHVNGNGWDDVGYHYVINVHGIRNHCRPTQYMGAHTNGHNDNSIGICLIGNNVVAGHEWNKAQVNSLHRLVQSLNVVFDFPTVFGHRDLNEGTLCPGFDVRTMFYGPSVPLKERGVLTV